MFHCRQVLKYGHLSRPVSACDMTIILPDAIGTYMPFLVLIVYMYIAIGTILQLRGKMNIAHELVAEIIRLIYVSVLAVHCQSQSELSRRRAPCILRILET